MSNISRDSFRETQNTLNDLRDLVSPAQPNPKHYVGIRLQQGVPIVDADWNEMDDIRRVELETVLARAIGSGVPAGSDGFRIRPHTTNDNFTIEAGLLFVDGWLVINPARIDYAHQPHRKSGGVAPTFPDTDPAAPAGRNLIFLDAWELEVDSQADDNLLNPRIGIETCTRLQRAWVVRFTTIADNADPLLPATIPNRTPRHRYYPLATIDRPAGSQITDGMINDLRRIQLTLDSLTFAPLLIEDVMRGRLDSARLAAVFRANLDVMRDWLARAPETFVYVGREVQSWQAMTAFNDVRASAVSFEQEASAQILHRKAALIAMKAFYQVQKNLVDTLQKVSAGGVGAVPITTFLAVYIPRLDGAGPTDKLSLKFAVETDDIVGAVLAQERLNQVLGSQSDTLPEGTITVNLLSITPTGALKDKNSSNYQLTFRIQSQLTSARGKEPIRVIVSAGTGWNLQFVGSNEPDPKELVVEVLNQQSLDVVLSFSANPGAVATNLNLTARPERRQQFVYTNPPIALALGQEVLPVKVIASLNYQGPALQANNTAVVPRSVMATATGVKIGFGITNLSTSAEIYQVTVTAVDPLAGTPITATSWQQPNQPVLQSLAPNELIIANINFRITDQAVARTPVAWRIQLTRVTGGANEPLTYTKFDLTFALT